MADSIRRLQSRLPGPSGSMPTLPEDENTLPLLVPPPLNVAGPHQSGYAEDTIENPDPAHQGLVRLPYRPALSRLPEDRVPLPTILPPRNLDALLAYRGMLMQQAADAHRLTQQRATEQAVVTHQLKRQMELQSADAAQQPATRPAATAEEIAAFQRGVEHEWAHRVALDLHEAYARQVGHAQAAEELWYREARTHLTLQRGTLPGTAEWWVHAAHESIRVASFAWTQAGVLEMYRWQAAPPESVRHIFTVSVHEWLSFGLDLRRLDTLVAFEIQAAVDRGFISEEFAEECWGQWVGSGEERMETGMGPLDGDSDDGY